MGISKQIQMLNQPKNQQTRRALFGGLIAVLALAAANTAQAKNATPEDGAPTQVVVTVVNHQRGAAEPVKLDSKDIDVKEDGKPISITGWKPLTTQGGTQFVLLIDDGLQQRSSVNINDLKKFILQLPPSIQVAVGYMQFGRVIFAADFTADRATVAKSIRIPEGISGVNATPYFCLTYLAQHWPDQGNAVASRNVLMITDGIDRYYQPLRYDPADPYVGAAIKNSQQSRLNVSSIYFRDLGLVDRFANSSFVGGSYLMQVADGTGGKMYYEGAGNPVTFVPFLADYQKRIANQYVLQFASKNKGLQRLQVKSKVHGIKAEAPQKFPVGE